MATIGQVNELRTAAPFRPFAVNMASGARFEVAYPELVACSKDGQEMALFDDDGVHLIDLMNIESLSPVKAAAPRKPKPKADRRS